MRRKPSQRNPCSKTWTMAEHNELGAWGEDLVAAFLEEKGFQIVERDWKSGHRDLDIVAMDGNTLVIVEVKTRRNRTFTDPETAVDYRKINNLRQAANHYVKFKRFDGEVRFDLVTVVGTPDTGFDINHIEDAF